MTFRHFCHANEFLVLRKPFSHTRALLSLTSFLSKSYNPANVNALWTFVSFINLPHSNNFSLKIEWIRTFGKCTFIFNELLQAILRSINWKFSMHTNASIKMWKDKPFAQMDLYMNFSKQKNHLVLQAKQIICIFNKSTLFFVIVSD